MSCLTISYSPLEASPRGAHYGVAIFGVNSLYSVALLSEVCNSDRCRHHQTLINSSRACLSSGGEGDLQFNEFPFGHNLQACSITEMENP